MAKPCSVSGLCAVGGVLHEDSVVAGTISSEFVLVFAIMLVLQFTELLWPRCAALFHLHRHVGIINDLFKGKPNIQRCRTWSVHCTTDARSYILQTSHRLVGIAGAT